MLKYIPNKKGIWFWGVFPLGPMCEKRPQNYSDEKIIALPGFDADSNKNQYSKWAKLGRPSQKSPGQWVSILKILVSSLI